MTLTLAVAVLSLGSGALVGFSLGLVGGGGSILAVPLLVYLVGVDTPHIAIGTSALAVAVSAMMNLASHARAGTVKWRCAAVFAAAGVVGAGIGSTIGQWVEGERLLIGFAVVMILVGIAMQRPWSQGGDPGVELTRATAGRLLPRLSALGLGAGTLSGFFGIGGGFLIVPGLMLATGMPILNAVGSSLVGVAAFGLATAGNYALNANIDWAIAGLFIIGGFGGGLVGVAAARWLAGKRRALNITFSVIIFAVAAYMLVKGFDLG